MTIRKKAFTRGIILPADDVGVEGVEGELKVGATAKKLQAYLDGALRSMVSENQTQALTNKTIDADVNTIPNLEVDNLKSGVLNTSTTLASATDVQIPSALAVKTYIEAQIGAHDAANEVTYSGTTSGLSATNVQTAIDQVDANLDSEITARTSADSAEALARQNADTALQGQITTNATNLSNHVGQATGAHAGSAISIIATGNQTGTNAQTAIDRLQTEIDAITTGGAGNVSGPASSVDNRVPVFSGTTGKILKQSLVSVNGGDVSGVTSLAASNATISGLNAATEFQEGFTVNSTLTGSNAILSPGAVGGVKLTNSGLVSISEIGRNISGKSFTIFNATGNSISINNNAATGTPEAGIFTGTKAALSLADQSSILLKYNDDSLRWHVIGGSGSASGASSLDTIAQLTGTDVAAWSTGNNATFLTAGTIAGTFAADTVAPLQGTSSYKYTQAAGSLNDWISSAVQPVDLRFRGRDATVYFPYTYNGGASDIQVVVYCATTGTILSPNALLPTTVTVGTSTFRTNVSIPATCSGIRFGFQVKTANSGKILAFDSVSVSADTTLMALSATPDWYFRAQGSTGSVASTTADCTFFQLTNSGSAATWNGSQLTIVESGTYDISVSAYFTTSVSRLVNLYVNGVFYRNIGDNIVQAYQTGNISDYFTAGQVLSIRPNVSSTQLNDSGHWLTVTKVGGRSNNILTAPDTFSTDTAALAYSSAYTLATLNTAPVGTYITFTYAANTNTRTQTTGTNRPAQLDSDMQANGILLYSRAYNATSTSGAPSTIAIQIGKGLKGVSLGLYKSAGKATTGTLDLVIDGTTTQRGIYFKEYNESTGVLIIDSGLAMNASITSALFTFSDISGQSSGYLTINASKNPALTGLNISAVAARVINSTGQSIPNATETLVLFDAAKTYDTHGAFNPATGYFTAPEAGYYLANWAFLLTDSSYGNGSVIYSKLLKNGILYSYGSFFETGNATSQNYNLSTLGSDGVFLAKGETLAIAISQTSGASRALQTTAGYNYFSIQKTSVG